MASFKGRKMHLSIDLEVTLFCFVGEFPPGSPLLTNLLAPNTGAYYCEVNTANVATALRTAVGLAGSPRGRAS